MTTAPRPAGVCPSSGATSMNSRMSGSENTKYNAAIILAHCDTSTCLIRIFIENLLYTRLEVTIYFEKFDKESFLGKKVIAPKQ
jgi:hypothetical protein